LTGFQTLKVRFKCIPCEMWWRLRFQPWRRSGNWSILLN